MGPRTQKAVEHLKGHQTLYLIVSFLSALSGIYLDYKSDVAEIEAKAKQIDDERGDVGTDMQQNMQLIYDRNMQVENRLSVLETEVVQLKNDNTSFWKLMLGIDKSNGTSGDGGTSYSGDYGEEGYPEEAWGDKGEEDQPREEDFPRAKKGLPEPPPLEQMKIKSVF